MSWGNPTLTKSFVAGAAVEKHRIVKFGGSDEEVVHGAAATDLLIGVTAEIGAASGKRLDVHLAGIAEVEAAGVIARGALVTANGSGQGVAAAPAQGANARVIGIALATTASGDIAPVLLTPGIMQGA